MRLLRRRRWVAGLAAWGLALAGELVVGGSPPTTDHLGEGEHPVSRESPENRKETLSPAASWGETQGAEPYPWPLSSLVPAVSEWLVSASGAFAPEAGESEGGDSATGILYGVAHKAAEAVNSAFASDQTREGVWVALHEQLGLVRDALGIAADDIEGVRSVSSLLSTCRLPLLRFAVERLGCEDAEADSRALHIVAQHPTSRAILAAYGKQEPDRSMKTASADLALLVDELKEYVSAFLGVSEGHPVPVSLLGAVEVVSAKVGARVNRCLATVSRYVLYAERFPRNKRSLLVFAQHVLPRVLQAFALQISLCRRLWALLAAAPAFPEGEGHSWGDPSAPPPFYSTRGAAALFTVAQNLGFRPTATPQAEARAMGRRLLARVQAHLGALHALSRGCLSATSASFQTRYAEAEARAEAGEAPSSAFGDLEEECLALAAAARPPHAFAGARPSLPNPVADWGLAARVQSGLFPGGAAVEAAVESAAEAAVESAVESAVEAAADSASERS